MKLLFTYCNVNGIVNISLKGGMQILKKYFFPILFLLTIMLYGCSSTNTLNKEDYLLENNKTSKNISIGSTSEEFKKAYANYTINIIYTEDEINGDNVADIIDINDVDFSKQSRIGITTYFIDGKSYTLQQFVDKLGIKTNYYDWAKDNTEYLEKHTVEGKALLFSFEDGTVTNVSSTDMNLDLNH